MLVVCGSVFAQVTGVPPTPGVTYTPSSELLNPTVNSWTGTVAGQNGGFVGGNTPAFNAGTNTIIFGYTSATAQQTIAINQALSAAGSGIKLGGYNYSWDIENDPNSGQYGTLTGNVALKSSTGATLQSYTYNYNSYTNGFVNQSGTQWFTQDYPIASVSDLTVSFTGKDSRFWAGYYGPRVRNPSLNLLYLNDLCATDPLSSPSCPGYAAAYQQQQCTISPLFDPSCPGYTTAQCTMNPLYNQSCPGYQSAYFTQQCTLNPLYAKDCPGYESAYLSQQCTLDSLYSTSCPGYAAAYAKKNVLGISTTSSSTSSTTKPKSEPSTSVSSDGKVETQISTTGDSNVDKAIESKASATPSATAPVQLSSSPPQGGPNAPAQTAAQQQSKPEPKSGNAPAEQPTARTARAERAERAEARSNSNEGKPSAEVKQAANEKAREEMKKAQTATTFESQIAVQQSVIGAMGFVPGFSSYAQANVPDLLQKQLQRQYGKDVIDNRSVGVRMFGGSDRLHEDMVNQQYQGRQ